MIFVEQMLIYFLFRDLLSDRLSSDNGTVDHTTNYEVFVKIICGLFCKFLSKNVEWKMNKGAGNISLSTNVIDRFTLNQNEL